MKRAFMAILLIGCVLCASACSFGGNENTSSATLPTSSLSENDTNNPTTHHSQLLGITFDADVTLGVDDSNTVPVLEVASDPECVMQIALQKHEESLEQDLTALPEEALVPAIEVMLTGDHPEREITVSNPKNYTVYESDNMQYTRISLEVTEGTDFSQTTNLTVYFIRLSTGKELAAICVEDAAYSAFDKYDDLVNSIQDAGDEIMPDKALSIDEISHLMWLSV